MLYVSLVLALTLLLLANLAAHFPRGMRGTYFVCGLLFTFGIGTLGIGLIPVFVLFFLLTVFMLPWIGTGLIRWFRGQDASQKPPRPWLYLPLSLAAFVVAFGTSSFYAFADQRRMDALRHEYPFESLEARLPARSRTASAPSRATERHLTALEEQLIEKGTSRSHDLGWLHDETVNSFVNSPGFGIHRGVLMMRERIRGWLKEGVRDDKSVPQPEPSPTFIAWPDETPWKPLTFDDDHARTHTNSLLDFAYPEGFGYFKDRRHVAGFQAHRFSCVPDAPPSLSVRRVDLVGLVKHAEPVAYVSSHLPRMDQLREAPTRPLDAFESAALEKLLQGEDLVVGTAARRTRMLGAVRAVKQCVECHGVERGHLLGAFSYTLQSSDP
jgi:hypothetical protein